MAGENSQATIKPWRGIGLGASYNLTSGSNSSFNVTVPYSLNPEYQGALRVYGPGAFIRMGSITADATGDYAPPNVLCYFALDRDTTVVGILGQGSGILVARVGTNGGVP